MSYICIYIIMLLILLHIIYYIRLKHVKSCSCFYLVTAHIFIFAVQHVEETTNNTVSHKILQNGFSGHDNSQG